MTWSATAESPACCACIQSGEADNAFAGENGCTATRSGSKRALQQELVKLLILHLILPYLLMCVRVLIHLQFHSSIKHCDLCGT